MSLCTDQTVVNNGPSEGSIATLRCKRWSCPDCAPACRQRVVRKARDGNPTAFLTLTWNTRRPESPDQAARAMKTAWVNLRRRIAKQWPGEKTPFIVVFERTQRGFPHMHILLRARFIPQKWLSDNMKDLIDAPVVDIRMVKNRQMAYWYITKYLGKEPYAFEGCKRWWRSHSYEVETDDDYSPILFGQSIVVEHSSYYVVAETYRQKGISIIEERIGYMHYLWEHAGGYIPRVHPVNPREDRWND